MIFFLPVEGRWLKKLLAPFFIIIWGVCALLGWLKLSYWFLLWMMSLLFSMISQSKRLGGGFRELIFLKSEIVWADDLDLYFNSDLISGAAFIFSMAFIIIFVEKIWAIEGLFDYFVWSRDLTSILSSSEYIFGRGGGAPWTILRARNCKLLALKGGWSAHIS